MLSGSLVVAIVGLIIAIVIHIVVMARWSGKIDTYLESMSSNVKRLDGEIDRLRDAKHQHHGQLQRHEGLLKEYERRIYATDTP